VARFASPTALIVRFQSGSLPHYVSLEAHPTLTAPSPFGYHQLASSPRTLLSQLPILGAHPSNALSSFRTALFRLGLAASPSTIPIPNSFVQPAHRATTYYLCSATSTSPLTRPVEDMVALCLLACPRPPKVGSAVA